MGHYIILALFVYIVFVGIREPWKAVVGYMGWVVLVPTWNWRWSLPTFSYQQWIMGSLVLGFIIHGWRRQILIPKLNMSLWSLFGYLVICFVAASQSEYSGYKVDRYLEITWKITLAIFLTVWLLDKPHKIAAACISFIVAQGWNAWNVNQLYYQSHVNVSYFSWNYHDNNVYSISSIPAFALSLALTYCAENIKLRTLGLAITVLQAHQIMILQSRGTMLGALLTVIIAVSITQKTKNWAIITLISIAIGAALAGPSVAEEFSSIFVEAEDRDSSAAGRIDLWRAGFQITMANPVLGVGPWCGERVVPQVLGIKGDYKALHNLLFEVSTGVGVIGLLCYLIFFFRPMSLHLSLYMRPSSKKPTWFEICNVGVISGIPGYYVASMFSSGALIESPYILGALAIASANVFLRELRVQEPPQQTLIVSSEKSVA